MADRPPSDRLFAVMSDGSSPMTYGELEIERDRIAYSLSQLLSKNVVAGAVYGRNSIEWCLCHQVCMVLGMRFSPINWHLDTDAIAFIVADCDADVVFFDAEFASSVSIMRNSISTVKVWVCMNDIVDGTSSLAQLLQDAPLRARPSVPIRRETLDGKRGTVTYHVDASGRMKGSLRQKNSFDSVNNAINYLEVWGLNKMLPTPVQLVINSMYHDMQLSWLSLGFHLFSTFVIMVNPTAMGALRAIQKYEVNGFYAPPANLQQLVLEMESKHYEYDVHSVKVIMSSGGSCPVPLKHGVVNVFGPVLYELYASSELGGVALMTPEHLLLKPLSCGMPAPGMDVILVDDCRQRIKAPFVSGEIHAKGFSFDGYHKLEERTQDAMFGDYFSVGDVGYFDEEGFLYLSKKKINVEAKAALRKGAIAHGLSVRQYSELRDMFAIFDTAGSGSIDPNKIREQMRSLGFEVDNTTMYQMINDLDGDGSQSIEFAEFANLMVGGLGLYKSGAVTARSCAEVFDYMDDLDASNRDARIEVSNLRRIADAVGDSISDAELATLVRCADRDGKHFVSVDDYYQLMYAEHQRISTYDLRDHSFDEKDDIEKEDDFEKEVSE